MSKRHESVFHNIIKDGTLTVKGRIITNVMMQSSIGSKYCPFDVDINYYKKAQQVGGQRNGRSNQSRDLRSTYEALEHSLAMATISMQ